MPYAIAAVMGLLLAFALWPWATLFEPQYQPVMALQSGQDLGPLLVASEKAETSGSMFYMLLLKAALPAYQAQGERHYFIEMLTYLSDRARSTDPQKILAQGISGLGSVTYMPASPVVISPPVIEPDPSASLVIPTGEKQPLIVIYQTHNSESFVPTTGQAHLYNNPEQTIVKVGYELARELQNLGATVIHSAEDHVRQAFDQSYSRSLQTIKGILSNYPDVDYVFDIHRDAVPRSIAITKINGQDVARVQIVVGTNESLGHPSWSQNYAHAQALQAELNRLYPGFAREILVRSLGRYNQHVHPKSLLIEVGTHENSIEEALRATKYLAEAIVAVAKHGQ